MAPSTHAGIDVSARSLAVSLQVDGPPLPLEFPNTAAGHRQLVRRLTKRGHRARVVVEASGGRLFYAGAPSEA